jgi:transcriptional regulator with XRE-family HTH domain
MDTHVGAERLRHMNNEPAPTRADRGARIERRMRLIGISQRAFAEHAKISRVTVKKAVEGDEGVLERNLRRIETALDELEEEMGIEPEELQQTPAAGPLAFRMTTPDGMEIIVSGPVEDADEMREQVMKLIAEFKTNEP